MSSSRRKWKFRVRHILEAAQRICAYTEGLTYAQFAADSLVEDAVIWNFTVIGEAARQISPHVEAAYPNIPWGRMRAMRNILVHDYDGVRFDTVWKTIQDDLPALIPLLQAVLESKDIPE